MDGVTFTDSQIEEFISEKKVVKNPKARWTEQRKSKRKNYDVQSVDGSRKYTLYIRQNTILPDNFSCGLRIEIPGRKPEHFAVATDRYNCCDTALMCLISDCNINGLKLPEVDTTRDWINDD